MEQNERIVTPYELATLASRINAERCVTDPAAAIAAAQKLLSHAGIACVEEKINREHREKQSEALIKKMGETRVDWFSGIKDITEEKRRDRAITRFAQFVESWFPPELDPKQELDRFQREGFTEQDVIELTMHFHYWKEQPKRSKGKQGRRKSPHDGRLRTDLDGLVPKKPRQRT